MDFVQGRFPDVKAHSCLFYSLDCQRKNRVCRWVPIVLLSNSINSTSLIWNTMKIQFDLTSLSQALIVIMRLSYLRACTLGSSPSFCTNVCSRDLTGRLGVVESPVRRHMRGRDGGRGRVQTLELDLNWRGCVRVLQGRSTGSKPGLVPSTIIRQHCWGWPWCMQGHTRCYYEYIE